jgi:small-conductance mechanosensitive channel
MPQRTDQRTRESVADDLTAPLYDDAESQQSSVRQRLTRRANSIFSPRTFLYAVLLVGAGLFAGTAFVPLPVVDSLTGLAGAFAGAFALGLAVKRGTVLESAAAGALAAGLATVFSHLALTAFGGAGVPLAAVGAGAGAIAGALGAHFGGDLRDGLTRDV